MTTAKQLLRMTEAQIAYVILTEMEVGLNADEDNPALEYTPIAGGDEWEIAGEFSDEPTSKRKPPSAEPDEVSQLRKALEKFGNAACDVYCKHKSKPRGELVQELGKVFFVSAVASMGVPSDYVGAQLGVACAVFFLKTGLDKTCAC